METRGEECFQNISIHALREEGDSGCKLLVCWCHISIHALREEGDQRCDTIYRAEDDFYPRPPRGGRRRLVDMAFTLGGFLSTPSARRATACG